MPTADQSGSISLFTTEGKAAGVLPLHPGSTVMAVAGRRIFVRAADGTLNALHRDGTMESLDIGPYKLTGIGNLLANPAGSSWVWEAQTADTSSQSVYAGGIGVKSRKLAAFDYPVVLVGYEWTPAGVILDSLPPDYNGYVPFNTPFGAAGGMRLLDPTAGTIRQLPVPSQCVFSDWTTGATLACFPTQAGYPIPNRHAIRIVAANGKTADLSLALPRFNYVGDGFFSPDGSLLAVAGATGAAVIANGNGPPSADPSLEQFGTDLITVADASIVRFGPSGVRLAMGRQSWLPDGRLVLWRPNTNGGAPGLYVLDPHGTGNGPEIETSGRPLGYLSS